LLGWLIAYWWLLLIEGIAVSSIVALLSMAAPRLVGSEPRSLSSLKASMVLTAIAILLAGIGLIVGVVELLGGGLSGGGGLALGVSLFVAALMIFQWLFSPYIINAIYRVRPPQSPYELSLQGDLERIARIAGLKKPPKLVIAEMDAPNAFAYGSPMTGSYVAVTRGLLRLMPREEIAGVLGHEVGHLRHRDVSWILALSLIPLAIYYLGRALIWTSFFTVGGRDEDDYSPLLLALIGVILVAAGVVFKFLVAHFNRLREYYADAHSVFVTGSPRPLQRALARIHLALKGDPRLASEVNSKGLISQLFIVAPLVEVQGGFFYDIDSIVEELKEAETNPIEELFSSHPPVPKRLRFLERLGEKLGVEVPVEVY
jgi:heat shock protein HtpX